ncbi:MAG: hypothetical protein ACJAY7_000510 [Pseudohongiellaceae bacterium]|jgi:hypothetical protein
MILMAAFDHSIEAGKPEVTRAMLNLLSPMELEINPE